MGFLGRILGKSGKPGENAKNKVVLHLISNKGYQAELDSIAKTLAGKFDKIIYVSLNKPAEKIAEIFKDSGIDTEKFIFIDAVNKKVGKNMAYHNFVFINSPKELEKFSSMLNEAVDRENAGCLIFDSLSTLLIYHNDSTIIKFAHDLISKLALSKYSGEFTCLSEDVDSALVKDIGMFVDEVAGSVEKEDANPVKLNIREQTAKLEKELNSVKQAYSLKFIAEDSYLRTKNRIENKLKNLRSRNMKQSSSK